MVRQLGKAPRLPPLPAKPQCTSLRKALASPAVARPWGSVYPTVGSDTCEHGIPSSSVYMVEQVYSHPMELFSVEHQFGK